MIDYLIPEIILANKMKRGSSTRKTARPNKTPKTEQAEMGTKERCGEESSSRGMMRNEEE